MTTVYRVLAATDWERARAAGTFQGSAHDVRDGFIHFSSTRQLADTLRVHYAGARDHVLLYVRTQAVPDAAWRWEPARDGSLFPHLYGSLPVSAVHRVEALPLGPDGSHQLPELETED
jgi:uncharacterized protein (DUF952 family)